MYIISHLWIFDISLLYEVVWIFSESAVRYFRTPLSFHDGTSYATKKSNTNFVIKTVCFYFEFWMITHSLPLPIFLALAQTNATRSQKHNTYTDVDQFSTTQRLDK